MTSAADAIFRLTLEPFYLSLAQIADMTDEQVEGLARVASETFRDMGELANERPAPRALPAGDKEEARASFLALTRALRGNEARAEADFERRWAKRRDAE